MWCSYAIWYTRIMSTTTLEQWLAEVGAEVLVEPIFINLPMAYLLSQKAQAPWLGPVVMLGNHV